MSRRRCEKCNHYKPIYAPFINRTVMTCELTNLSPYCKLEYEPIQDDKKNK